MPAILLLMAERRKLRAASCNVELAACKQHGEVLGMRPQGYSVLCPPLLERSRSGRNGEGPRVLLQSGGGVLQAGQDQAGTAASEPVLCPPS